MRRRDRGSAPEETLVYGHHPVAEAVEGAPQTVERIFVAREGAGRLGRILRAARERGIPVSHVDRGTLSRKAAPGASHQGIAAVLAAAPYRAPGEVLAAARDERRTGLLVGIDGVEDPRNLGAIVRSSAAAGAVGILLGVERTAGLTPAAVKTSAGAALSIPVARDPRLGASLRGLAGEGWAVVALVPRGGDPPESVPGRGRVVLVAGGEERGLRPGLLRECGAKVTIPLHAGIESLNVSVAVGVVLFEIARQRRASGESFGDFVPTP